MSKEQQEILFSDFSSLYFYKGLNLWIVSNAIGLVLRPYIFTRVSIELIEELESKVVLCPYIFTMVSINT